MKKSVFRVLVCIFVSCALLFSCKKSSSDEIVVGVFEPLTGENGGGGYQELMGIQYANQVYPSVKINGKDYKIKLEIADNKSDKTEAVTAAQSLVSKGSKVIVGSYGSGVSIAAGGIFSDNRIPAIGTSCTNPQVTLGNDYYFRVAFLDPFQGKVVATYAYEKNKSRRAAIITQLGDDYSMGLGAIFKSEFIKLGGKVIAEEYFQTNTTDFKAILTNIKETSPDVIFAPSSITTAPLLIRQARELGITCLIAGGDTWENPSVIESAGADAEGVVLSTHYDDAQPMTGEGEKFVNGFVPFLKKQKQSEIITAVSALSYDAYLAAYYAIQKAQSLDPVKIKDALKNLEFDGVTGHITFDENGDAAKDTAYMKKIEDGKFKFVDVVKVN